MTTGTIEHIVDELMELEDDCEPSEVLDAWVGAMNRASQALEDAASRYVEGYICGRMEDDARRQALHGLLTHPDMRPDLLTEVRWALGLE